MKYPPESGFTVNDEGSQIVIRFKPTESYFTFARLDPTEWKQHGEVSAAPTVRHAQTGDTGPYIESDVGSIAYGLALRYARQLGKAMVGAPTGSSRSQLQ